MKSLFRIGALVTAVAVAMVAPALAANDITVGDFVQRLAMAKNLNATDTEIAVDSLGAVGIRIPADVRLDARLTEARVVKIARAAGLRVTSSNPDRAFTDDQVDSFFFAFADELAPIGGSSDDYTVNTDYPYGDGNGQGIGPMFDPFSKGKGKHKGKAKGWQSPTEPE